MHSSSSNSSYFRSHRMKPAKWRTKCDKIKWDGLPSSFKKFRRELEGHLSQVGASYMIEDSFIEMYTKIGIDYLKSGIFWIIHQILTPQAYEDRNYLFGILMTATSHMQNKIIIKYQNTKDGILAWSEFKKEYGYEGSKDLRLKFLEDIARKPYTKNTPGGFGSYIDHFQAHIGELESMVPDEYYDAKKKRLLLMNIRDADGMAHLLQKCRDDPTMSFDTCATYIKEYAALVEKTNMAKPPRTLMHGADNFDFKHEPEPTKSLEGVCQLFHTMSKASGLRSAYNVLQSKDFRESLYIPQAIWNELEPSIRQEVMKAKNKAKEKKANNTNSNQKLPYQYPTKKNQESIINLCSSIADMGFDGDDST